jgi:putative phosphoribosyl transferase
MGSAGRHEPPFEDRAAAGRLLADPVAALNLDDPLVLALPRGGVPVGYEICRRLAVPLDVLVTRKIGHPREPELGVGAIAEGGEPVLDGTALKRLRVDTAELDLMIERERTELARRVATYRGGRGAASMAGRDVVVVDDGLATGGTARAALRAVRLRNAARVVLAVPVGARETIVAMGAEADEVVVLAAPRPFRAVGQWYLGFDQLTDSEVLDWLERARR